MNRKDLIDKIAKYTARFEAEVKSYNDMGLYDINIHAENALIPILNIAYGLELTNANANGIRNVPAVDLVDEDSRVAFQVTSTAGIEKIKKTLETFKNYQLHKQFDTLYVFILNQKQASYSDKSLAELLPQEFDFDVKRHIVDLSDVRARIIDIQSIPSLTRLAKICEYEFSDIQISERKKVFQDKFLSNDPEAIFLNFLEIAFPRKFYAATISIDEKLCVESINGAMKSLGRKQYKSFKPETLFREAKKLNEVYGRDFILHEGKVLTFRNLTDRKEQFRKLSEYAKVFLQ